MTEGFLNFHDFYQTSKVVTY